LLTGNAAQFLPEDPSGSGLRLGYGRGNLWSTSDSDYYSFSGKAGDTITLAVEIPGHPGSSQIRHRVLKPDGGVLIDLYEANTSGFPNQSTATLPVNGTYTVLVTYNYDYESEYQFKVIETSPALQQEGEANDGTSGASPVTLTTSGSTSFAS